MKTFFGVTFSFLIALLLSIIPMPSFVNWLRPEWVLLVLIYWALMLPGRVGVSIAFFLGLVMDLLRGTLFGAHALAFVLITYFVIRFCQQFRMFPLWQQAVLIFMLTFLYQTFQFWVWGISGVIGSLGGGMYWMPSVTTAILWPLVYAILGGSRERRAY